MTQPRFFEIDTALRFEDPRLHDFVGYWQSKRRGERLPARADIDPIELRRFLGDLFMLDVVGEPARFRYRLIGVNIVMGVGRDSTGKFLDEVFEPERAAENIAHYRAICRSRQPTRAFGVINWVDRGYLKYEIANVPLARDGETVDIILGCMSIGRAPATPDPTSA